MKDIIEKLKDKNYVRAFGLMSPDEQECFKKVGKEDCLYFDIIWKPATAPTFSDCFTYAINPDYQPEPEYEDCEIKQFSTNRLGITYRQKCFSNPNSIMIPIYEVPSLPNFEGFYEEDEGEIQPLSLSIESLARNISEGNKVYARFRTTS